MTTRWLALIILWSVTITVLSLEFSATNPSVLPDQASYYLAAESGLHHLEPSEELKRTHRSFFNKLWKNTWLQDLFGYEGCNTCCNNKIYNAGECDTYESPPPAYNPYFQQLPPLLPSSQQLHPLRILEPLFKPWNFDYNVPNGGGYINNYDGNSAPSVNEGGNNYDCCGGKSKLNEGCNCNYCKDKIPPELHTAKEYGKIFNKQPEYSSDIANNKDGYVRDQGKYAENEPGKGAQTYSGLDGGGNVKDSIVYQPIILVLPKFQHAATVYNISSSSHTKTGITDKPPYVIPQPIEYSIDNNGYKGNIYSTVPEPSIPSNPPNNFLNQYGCSFSSPPYCEPLLPSYGRNEAQKYLPITLDPVPDYYPSHSISSNFNSNTENIIFDNQQTHSLPHHNSFSAYNPSGDIAPYANINQAANKLAPPTEVINNQPSTSPIQLTELDQPYRNCPELFTDYLNLVNHNYNQPNTFTNTQFIYC